MKVLLACASTLLLSIFGYQAQSQPGAAAEVLALDCPSTECPAGDCEIVATECLPSGECEVTCEGASGETCTFVVDCEQAADCDLIDCDLSECDDAADCEPAGECGQASDGVQATGCEPASECSPGEAEQVVVGLPALDCARSCSDQ